MNPYERIREVYAKNPQQRTFEFYLVWHIHHGFVFSTPDYFVMGRPVDTVDFDPNAAELRVYRDQDANAFYIHAMAGKMPRLWDIMPYPLPKIGWERIREGKRELNFYSVDTLMRLCPPENETCPSSIH